MYLACEVTSHYACRNSEMNLKSKTTNRFNFWIINSLMKSWVVRLTWLHPQTQNKLHHVKVLMKRFHLNVHIIEFHPQTQKVELRTK